MRTVLSLAALALTAQLSAQCTFTPTIDPPDLIMCPLTTDTLTTEGYDSYQWYKNGQPIPGATLQHLVVDYFSSVSFDFTVEGTLNGCTALSAPAHVNGWAFMAPSVFTSGDVPHDVDVNGTPFFCQGDTVQLTLGAPYTASVTWFKDGVPIPGATAPSVTITSTGSYYAHAAPDICPNLITGLDLDVDMVFDPAVQPTITQTILGALCATPADAQYEWTLNGTVIPGANTACHEPTASGVYAVRVLPAGACDLSSEPFTYIITGVDAVQDERPWTVIMEPAGDALTIQWSGALEPGATWRVLDLQGLTVSSGALPKQGPLQVDAAGLPQGMHLFQALHHGGPLAPATRFTVLR